METIKQVKPVNHTICSWLVTKILLMAFVVFAKSKSIKIYIL